MPSPVQFATTGDRGLLGSAEAGVQRLLESGSQPPPQELWDTPMPPEESNFGDEVAASIVEWICDRLSDYHANFHDKTALMQVYHCRCCVR